MPRSRSALLLVLGTFATLLFAVRFADGGHQSPLRPADMFRLDLDDVADGGAGSCHAWYAEPRRPLASPAISEAALDLSSGASGWIALPIPGAAAAVIIYVDDETACQIAVPAWEPADSSTTGVGQQESGGTEYADFAAENLRFVLAELYGTAQDDPLAPAQVPYVSRCEQPSACRVHDSASPGDELALAAAAAFVGMPDAMVWQTAVDRSCRCEFAWHGCDGYPDASVGGWTHQAESLAAYELWRAVGRAASSIFMGIAKGRNELLTVASRGLAAMVCRTTPVAHRPTQEPIDSDLVPWPNLGRSTGSFLSL